MKRYIALGVAVFLASSSIALAGGVNVQTFTKSTGPRYEASEPGFIDEGALGTEVRERELLFSFHYHFANNPLVEVDPVTDRTEATLVDGIHTLQLNFGYRIEKNVGMIVLPVHAVKLTEGNRGYAQAFGDIKVQGRREVLRSTDEMRALSVIVEGVLPTGDSDYFVSNGGIGFGVRGALEQKWREFSFVANLGFMGFSSGTFRDIDYRRQIPYSLGVSAPVLPNLALNAELFQSVTLPKNKIQNPGELYFGAKMLVSPEIVASGGISIGQADFTRANDIRVQLGAQIRLGAKGPSIDY